MISYVVGGKFWAGILLRHHAYSGEHETGSSQPGFPVFLDSIGDGFWRLNSLFHRNKGGC